MTAQLVDLVRRAGDRDVARPLPGAVDPVALDRLLDPGQVVAPQPFERPDLIGEPLNAVRQAVRQRGIGEPAVAAGRAIGDRTLLEQDDVAPGVVLLRLQGGPEAGETAADHGQRARLLPRERLRRGRPQRRVQPVRPRLRIPPAARHGSRIW
jgi:hypothetical protein